MAVRLSKRSSLFIAFGSLAVFFAAALLISPSSQVELPEEISTPLDAPTPRPIAELPREDETGARFSLSNFHRSEVRDGKLVWEVRASNGEYFPETENAEVREANVLLFDEQGRPVRIEANHALLKLKGTALVEADASGNVRLTYYDGTILTTERAIYHHEQGVVRAPGKVHIQNERMEIEGVGMTAKLDEKTFHLDSAVRTLIKPYRTGAS